MGEYEMDNTFRRKFRTQLCMICGSVEGCDHTVKERLRALTDADYRDQMRREDPLYQLQQERRRT